MTGRSVLSFLKRPLCFGYRCVTVLSLQPVVLAALYLTIGCSSAAAEVESLQRKESMINECSRKIADYDRNKNSNKYSQPQLDELLKCIELIDTAAKRQIKEPNTIFRSQQEKK